jgi:hypothetical protein
MPRDLRAFLTEVLGLGCGGDETLEGSRLRTHSLGMFLRRNRRVVNGESYGDWTLVRTNCTARGPRQEVVTSLGKLAGLDHQAQRGWEEVSI